MPARTTRDHPRTRRPDSGTLLPPDEPDVALNGATGHVLAAFAAADLEAFIDAALQVLKTAVTCEFASVFYVTGPDGLLKERDSRGREYSGEFMRRYAALSPAIPIALANPGIEVLSTRTAFPSSERALRKTAFFREIMQPQGWRHAVALCFWDDPPAALPAVVASVNRTAAQGDFPGSDLAVLHGLHALLDRAVRLLRDRDSARAVQECMAAAMCGGTRGHAILDAGLGLIEATPIARRLCAAWDDSDAPLDSDGTLRWGVPPALLAVCRELEHEWRSLLCANPGVTGVRLHRHIAHPSVPGLTATVTIVCPRTHGLGGPTFMLEFDRRVRGMTLDGADPTADVLRLMTPSQRAVALVLADGFSNQEIADRLGKTVSAVKFLLHKIYERTEVPNRAALVAVLRGNPHDGR